MTWCSDIFVGTASGRIMKFDKDGNLLQNVQHMGSGAYNAGNYFETSGIVVDSNSNVFICTTTGDGNPSYSQGYDIIERLDSTLSTQTQFFNIAAYFGRTDRSVSEQEMSLAIDKSNNLYLMYKLGAPSGSPPGTLAVNHLLKISPAGVVLNDWLPDDNLGTFLGFKLGTNYPHLDFAKDNKTLYYTFGRGNIFRWDVSTGTQLTKFKDNGPVWIATDPNFGGVRVYCDGRVIVTDTSADGVRIYDSTGTLVNTYTNANVTNPYYGLALAEDVDTFWTDVNNGFTGPDGTNIKKWHLGVVVDSVNTELYDPQLEYVGFIASCMKPKDRCGGGIIPSATVVGAN